MISIVAVLITTISAQNYMYDVITLTMNDSEAYCRSKYGTSLASIHNAEQNQEATSICLAQHICWIGLNDIDVEGQYVWTDGTKYDYGINASMNESPWEKGEPNDKNDEDCVAIDTTGWNDVNCDEIYPDVILCNYPTIEPTNNPTNIINPTKDALDHTTRTLLINTTAIITLPMHQTTISMHQTKAMTASPSTKTNNAMTVNLSDDNDDGDGDSTDDTLWKTLGVTASSVCIVFVLGICIAAIIWFKSNRNVIIMNEEENSDFAELPRVVTVDVEPGAMKNEENEELESSSGSHDSVYNMEGVVPEPRITRNTKKTVQSDAGTREMNLEMIGSNDAGVEKDENYVNEEQKEDAILDEMLSDIVQMQNVDPNKIHQININDAVNHNNNDSDSDNSDTMYLK